MVRKIKEPDASEQAGTENDNNDDNENASNETKKNTANGIIF